EAREISRPKGKGVAPILWRLLTTLPVTNVMEAIEKVAWYAQRWQLEVIHKILKSGCQVEQRQLETAQRLERVLSVDLVVAWRILALCKAARELPEDPVSNWLPTAQWQALWCYVHQQRIPPQIPPALRQAVRWIAQLGGFLARKSDGEPGTTTLWRGLLQLDAMTKMWELCHDKNRRQKCG
ncbi:MAG: IS4 family transposase, partial [Verrucomicrobia bacterium]